MFRDLLVRLAGGDLARQVFLFIVQVLELEMQPIDLLASLCSRLLGVAHTKDGISVLTAELGEPRKQEFLLLGSG